MCLRSGCVFGLDVPSNEANPGGSTAQDKCRKVLASARVVLTLTRSLVFQDAGE